MRYKKATAILVAALWVMPAVYADDEATLLEARKLTTQFMKTLKGTLMQAMQKGGPVEALAVCNTEAGPIAQELAKEHGWKLGRTSFKLRNPANAPDAWEKQVLQQFADQWQGQPLEAYAWVNEGKTFRYMKSIAVKPPCLACHGSQLAPEVAEKIREHYPEDQATGYKAGELRGAFTLEYTRP